MQKWFNQTVFRGLLWCFGRKLHCNARREVVRAGHRAAWQLIRGGLKLWNLAETGSADAGV